MIQQGTPEDAFEPQTPHGDESTSLQQNKPVTKHSKDSSTARQSQMAFATDIAQGLINEVRKLQQALQEKDRLIMDLEISKADSEKDNELTQKQLRQKNSIEDKLKEDNWNLEVANQDLQSNLSDLSQTVTKLNADHSKALKQLRAALEQVEIFKAQQEKSTSIIDALKARHDHEQQVLRRNNGTLQRDMVQLKKRMDEVNTELKICKSKLAIRSTVSSNNIQQLLRGNNDNEHNDGDGTDSDRLESPGTGGDTLALETATSNTTANTQRALELETLKQSLGHAHRMISNLRNNLQKEKVEKIELKKVLADTQDSLDQLEKGAMQNETGRGSLKKNAVVNKIKVVRKRGGVARKGLSGTNTTSGTYLGEDQSNSLAIHTTLGRGDYDNDNGQLLEDHDDFDSADDNVSMDDSNSLQHDSADEDDLHRLDLSPIQQGQSLDMELQLGGFNSSFKPLSSELEETLDKRQYSDKGVNTCSDLASTLSFGQQTTSHIRSSACIINGDDTTDVNSNSGNDGVNTEYTVINSVSTPSKSLSNVSSSDNMASSQPVLDLKRSPIPSSAGITKQLQQEEQQPTLYNEDAFDNATQSLGGSITPMPGSPSLNQQNLHSLDIVIGNTASLNKPENDISITATDPQEDGDHNPLFVTTTSIPAITDSTTDNKHTTAEAPQDTDSTVTWIINSDASDKHLTHASDNSQKPTLIPLSNDDIMHAGEVININQSLYAPSVTQQSNPPLLETNEHHENTALSSLSDKEQLGLDLLDATTVIEYSTRDANSLTDSALITTTDVDELKQVTILDKNTYSDNQVNSVKDNKVVVDTDNKPNHQQNAALDLHADKIDDIDRTTPIPEENSQTFNSTLRPDSVTATDSDDGNNTIADININSNSLMMDTLDMMSREEADALIKAGIADALAKERLEAATRRQELDDNFITRSEAEAMAKEQTERAVKKERDRASTMLTKAQADSLARSYAEQTLQEDQQRRQSQEHTTSTYPASSFLTRAQAAASNKASGSSITQAASRRASQTSVVPSPKPSTSTSSTATVSSSSSSSSRLGKLSGFMNIQPSVSTPAKSNPLRPSASMSSLRRTTTMSSSISHHQQPYRPSQQKSQPQRQDDLLQPPSALSYGSVRITETSTYSKHPSTGSLKQQHLKQPSIQSLSSARSGMAPSLFSMGDLAKQGANGDLISAITQTMIGEWMWKHTRKHVGGGISVNKHKRFFWVHPYTRTLYWSTHEPGVNADESKAKSAFIESISSIPSNDTMGASPLSLLIKTAKRDLKLTAPNLERHEIWRMSLSYLLVPPGEDSAMEDVVQVDPYHETTTSAGSCLSRTLSSTTDVTTDTTIPTSQQSQPSDQLHPSTTINGNNTDNTTNDVTYARQGADDHDMSTSVSP